MADLLRESLDFPSFFLFTEVIALTGILTLGMSLGLGFATRFGGYYGLATDNLYIEVGYLQIVFEN